MSFLILEVLFIAVICMCFFSRYLGYSGIIYFLTSLISGLTCLSWFQLWYVLKYNIIVYVSFSTWLTSNLLIVDWGFNLDLVTNVMLVLVISISFLVHLYSIGYLNNDPHQGRFIVYLSLFTSFMVLIITSNNLLLFFLSWEGVGLCSYLLINFWYTRVQANKAALKALFVNRIGDIFLLVGISLVFVSYGTLDFNILNVLTQYKLQNTQLVFCKMYLNDLTIIGLCFIIGVVGKSAQIGLHTWLPDAMEGPTPVSAILHAATMVTAGIFLLLKCSFLLEYNPIIKNIIICLGLITAFFAASVACAQTDLKKIIAYSTCSQLGYMVFTVGFSQYQLSLFHLFNHGFFKALIFLSAGVIIHNFYDEQDIRRVGNVQNLLPSVYIINLIATLAITGFPFLTGFFSKDLIIETAFNITIINNCAVYWIIVFTAALTAFYSFKILFIIFYSPFTSLKYKIEQFHHVSNFIFLPILILSVFSCFTGFIVKELFVGAGTNTFLFLILPENGAITFMNEFLNFEIKLIPFMVSICAVFLAIGFYTTRINILVYKKQLKLKNLFFIISFFSHKYGIDNIINRVSNCIFKLSYIQTYKLIDKNIIEYCVVNALNSIINRVSNFSSSFNTGLLTHHISLGCLALLFFIGLILTF